MEMIRLMMCTGLLVFINCDVYTPARDTSFRLSVVGGCGGSECGGWVLFHRIGLSLGTWSVGACDHFYVNTGGITSMGRYWLQGGQCGGRGDGGIFNMDDYHDAGGRWSVGARFL